MKAAIIIYIALFLSIVSFGQKKGKTDQQDLTIDSLTSVNSKLTTQNDSLSGELTKYYGIYVSLKEDVFKRDFDPATTSSLLDSMISVDDKALVSEDSIRQSFRSSLNLIQQELQQLHGKLDSLMTPAQSFESAQNPVEMEKADAISNLKNLKELLDAGIINQTEFLTAKKKYLPKL